MQKEKLLPVQYRIEFYEESTINDPVYYIQTSSAPFPISVGDKVEPKIWEYSQLELNKIYKVIDVTHLVFSVPDSHVTHSLSVVVTSIDRE